ncbi:hypothetical protein P4O66_019951, partial [Electrophorus voltai]
SFPSVKVNLHDDATLPCTQTCSGLVTWTLYHKPHDILAQCNQTSCQSEEGFHMSHNQYLKGDLSLTITDADYTKRSLYTCACKGQEICDMSLQIEGTGAELPLSHNPSRSHHSDHSEVQPCPNQSSTVMVLTVLLALMGAGLVAAVLVIVQLRKKIQEL